MKKNLILTTALIASVFLLSQCDNKSETKDNKSADSTKTKEAAKPNYGGYENQVKWGEHLVTICGCNDCHTPKKMGPHGPELDSALILSGHPAKMPAPDVNRKDMESKGLVVTNTLTAWVGPWGISYAGNLTSDPTGIGGWQEENFIRALREGKFKGIENARLLLPPMPWEFFKSMSDDEIKAIFAYLKSTKPIQNVVPPPAPPVMAAK
jgi:cytochrome c553